MARLHDRMPVILEPADGSVYPAYSARSLKRMPDYPTDKPARPVRIVHARRPTWRPAPRPLAFAAPLAKLPTTSPEALRAFQALIADWRLSPARAWRMLTGVGYQAGSLSPELVNRVDMLVELDRIMRPIAPVSVGEWMVEPFPRPPLDGSAPVDYLTKRGGRGYAALLRQAQLWAAK